MNPPFLLMDEFIKLAEHLFLQKIRNANCINSSKNKNSKVMTKSSGARIYGSR